MKKAFLLMLAAGVFFASCNSGEGGETTATDTTGVNTNTVNNPNTGAETPAAPTGPTTSISFAETDYNWGKIKEGEVKEHTFTFTNTGSNDLIISNAKGSCGCTVPYYPTEPIPPGGKGEIKVSFDSKGKSGVQQKQVTITANTDPSVTTLNITSEIEGGPAPAAN